MNNWFSIIDFSVISFCVDTISFVIAFVRKWKTILMDNNNHAHCTNKNNSLITFVVPKKAFICGIMLFYDIETINNFVIAMLFYLLIVWEWESRSLKIICYYVWASILRRKFSINLINISGSIPAAPENITVTFINPTSVRVSWQQSIDAQYPVEKYDVTYKPIDAR